MLSKTKIKFLQSLQHKKFRQLYQRFLIDGDKTVRELLESPYKIEAIYAEPWWLKKFNSLVKKDIEVNEISEVELQKVATHQSANGVLAVAEIPVQQTIAVDKVDMMIALDGINDPGNMGTIIRSAEWFGINTLICSGNCVDVYNPKVVNAAKGSLFRANVNFIDLKDFFIDGNFHVYGATLEGENIFTADVQPKGVILIGSEANGISPDLYPFITKQISIPAGGKAESLNAGVATGIICAEFFRRKLKHQSG